MLTLQEAIRSLRADIAQALATDTAVPNDVQLAGNRASITLSVTLSEATARGSTQPQWMVLPGTGGPHSVTVEFAFGTKTSSASGTSLEVGASKAAETPASSGDIENLFTALSGVFDAPGFDSSARATVFRECLADLPPEQATVLLASLGQHAPAKESPEAGRARLRITRLASLASSKPDQALTLLAQRAPSFTVSQIIGFVAERWKTQGDWIER